MGLFGRKKQAVVSVPEKSSGNFLYSVSNWTTEVKLDSRFVVPQGSWCIFVAKDKPCDVLEAGEHIITLDKIPLLTRTLKLQKPIVQFKRGKQEKIYRTSFKCFVYFVNKNALENLAWQTDNIVLKQKKVEKEDKSRFDVILSGVTDVRCVDPAKMMKFFLYEWAKVDSFRAQNRITEYLGEIVQEVVHKIRSATPQEIDDLPNFTTRIAPEILKEFAKYGMELSNFEVTKAIFDRDVASKLLQEKMQNDITSDAINELGAEISVQDDEVLQEQKRKTKKNVKSSEVVKILDMTDSAVGGEEVIEKIKLDSNSAKSDENNEKKAVNSRKNAKK